MVERMEAGARQQLGELNALAGADYEQARELVMYEQSITSAGDELLDPLFDALRARLDERQGRRRRTVNGDPAQPAGAGGYLIGGTGPRRLVVENQRPPSLYDQDADPDLESPGEPTIRLAAAPEPPPAPGRGKAGDGGPEVRT